MKLLSEFVLEMAKWKKMVSAGKISTKGIRRLRKAGNIRPEKEEIKRLKKATDTILKKTNSEKVPFKKRNLKKAIFAGTAGIDVKDVKVPKKGIVGKVANLYRKHDNKSSNKSVVKNPMASHFTVVGRDPKYIFDKPGKNTVTSPTRKQLSAAKKAGHKGAKAGAVQGDHHEALETLAIDKARRGKDLAPIKTKVGIAKRGSHLDQSVLRGEKKLTDYHKHAYKGKGLGTAAEKMDKVRKNTIDKVSGKSERQLTQMKRKQLEKLNKRK